MSRSPQSLASASQGRTRLLYVINDLTVGGAQRALLSQAEALARDRFEVHVASLELVAEGTLTGAFRDVGVEVHLLAAPGEAFGLAPLRVQPLVVSTLHNVSDWVERRHHPLRAIDRATLPLADSLCAVSNAVREAVAKVSPKLALRTRTLRNGVDLERFRPPPGARAAARARAGFAPADFVIATVARLEPSKGIETLLRAAARASTHAPMLQLLIVGDGSDRVRLETLAESLDIAAWVTFAGTRDDVPQLLAAADLFAVPSRTEGLGVAAIEALAAGLPVLASNVGGLPEIVQDRVCGRLLPHDDVDAWTDAIASAAVEPEALRPWSDAAFRCARAFSIESSVEALEQLYASLRDRSGRRRKAA